MSSLVQYVKQFVREEGGVSAIEYGLIAALIAIVIIGAVKTVAPTSIPSSRRSAAICKGTSPEGRMALRNSPSVTSRAFVALRRSVRYR